MEAEELAWAYTGSLRSKAHIAVSESYQIKALCGVGIAGSTLIEIRPASGWCPKCVRIVRAGGIDPNEVGIENDLM